MWEGDNILIAALSWGAVRYIDEEGDFSIALLTDLKVDSLHEEGAPTYFAREDTVGNRLCELTWKTAAECGGGVSSLPRPQRRVVKRYRRSAAGRSVKRTNVCGERSTRELRHPANRAQHKAPENRGGVVLAPRRS